MNNIKKIIEYGLYLLAFLLPIQTRWIIKSGEINGGYWEYGTVSLYATDILLLALLGLFIISRFKKQVESRKLKVESYWWFIVLIELAAFVSIFFAQDKSLAIYNYLRLLLGFGLFWLVISAEYNKAKLIWSLIAGAAIQACLGIWQFITQSTFSSKWLGMAAHKAGELGTSVLETAGKDGIGERWLRAYGGLDHPNMLGGFLAIGILLLFFLYLENSKSEILNTKQITKKILSIMCCVLCVAGLFFTFSRAAWLGLVIGLLVMMFFMAWQKDIGQLKRIAEIILPAVAVIFILSIFYNNLVFTRIASAGRLEVKSNIERIESYKFSRDIIKKNWLFGTGIGNYTLALKNEISIKRQGYYYQPVHNIFLLIWAEIGILGLAGFLGFMLCVMCYALSEKKNGIKALNFMLIFSVIIPLTTMMFVDHWLWSLHFGALFLWLIFGIIFKEDNYIKSVDI